MTLRQAKTFYVLVARNQRMRDRRHPMFERNMLMKVFGYIFIAFWAVYLMMLGFMCYQMFDGGGHEAFDMVDGGMIFILALDFFLRFAMQETPAQDIKPYKLSPIPIRFLLNVFLVRMGLRIYNFFWFFFLVPFALFAVVKFYGIIGLLSYLLGWWFLFVINSYWYLLCRTFVNRNVYFILLPIAIYALLIYFGIFSEPAWLFDACVWIGRLFVTCNPLMYLLFFALAIGTGFLVNLGMHWLDSHYPHMRRVPIASLCYCFLLGYIAETYFGIADITGAYVAGVVLCNLSDRDYIEEKVDISSYMVFAPLFFTGIGLKTSFSAMNLRLLIFSILFVVVALTGKVIGCGGSALLLGFNRKDSLKIGIGMMSRGEVALITAQKGLAAGLLTADFFTAIILLILVSSIVTPICLNYVYRKDP